MVAGDVAVDIFSNNDGISSNDFNATTNYIEFPHAAAFLGANMTGLTISAWIFPEALGEVAGQILNKSTDANDTNGISCGIYNPQMVYLRFNNEAAIKTSATGSIPYNTTWKHVLFRVSNNTTLEIYINGALSGGVQTMAQGLSTLTTVAAPRIGNRSGATDRTFDGGIKNVKVWNRAITDAEIQADYRSMSGAGSTDGLIHWFKLGGDYNDYGSVGVAATNSGSRRTQSQQMSSNMKTRRATAGATGKYMITATEDGQIINVAITG